MADKTSQEKHFEKLKEKKERVFEKPEKVERKPEEKTLEKPEEKKPVPEAEILKTPIPTAPPTFKKRDLAQEQEKMVENLVSTVLKNPDAEKGLEEATKYLNEYIQKLKKQGEDYSYIVDEFHDRLMQKIQEREQKFRE